jgi:hypothetical protein
MKYHYRAYRHQNAWDEIKDMIRENFIAINTYVRKAIINKLSIHFKKKKTNTEPKKEGRNKTIKITEVIKWKTHS